MSQYRKEVYSSPPLDDDGDVNRLLKRLGLGTLIDDGTGSGGGRNDNWIGRTTGGRGVFVKRLSGIRADAEARFERTVEFSAVSAASTWRRLSTPQILGHCATDLIMVFELIEGASSGAEVAAEDAFTPELSERVAEALAELHSTDCSDRRMVTMTPQMPSLELVDGISFQTYLASSAAELEVWRLIQSDRPLREGLVRLKEMEKHAGLCPVHTDFRLDQLLVRDDQVDIIDWEEFRLGDPARDVGSYIGDWVFRATLDVARADDGETGFIVEPTHSEVVERGVRSMARLKPLVSSFWRAYTRAVPVGEGFRRRVAAYAGWHLFDRLIASAWQSPRLPAIARAGAGIGRNLLLDPDRYAAAAGIEEVA